MGAVDTKHHLIVAREVTNVGTDKSQLSAMAEKTKAALETDALDVVADRGYFSGTEILACDEAGCPSKLQPGRVASSPALAARSRTVA